MNVSCRRTPSALQKVSLYARLTASFGWGANRAPIALPESGTALENENRLPVLSRFRNPDPDQPVQLRVNRFTRTDRFIKRVEFIVQRQDRAGNRRAGRKNFR
ncbi:hypothetical protein OFAG_02302 [Oxalobacter formigenes HOxBLS]|uniref:Uncharacterized protein n=1 Tax=Oxalobacter paraformigenes TaxID=556268 RepID=T5LSV8_9BURK|nr:hypothetical protein OFAG_02302 [Oxalobacter paraformigenes]